MRAELGALLLAEPQWEVWSEDERLQRRAVPRPEGACAGGLVYQPVLLCFFVPKAKKKRVSAAEWAAMPVEKRIKLLRLVIGSGGRFHYEFP